MLRQGPPARRPLKNRPNPQMRLPSRCIRVMRVRSALKPPGQEEAGQVLHVAEHGRRAQGAGLEHAATTGGRMQFAHRRDAGDDSAARHSLRAPAAAVAGRPAGSQLSRRGGPPCRPRAYRGAIGTTPSRSASCRMVRRLQPVLVGECNRRPQDRLATEQVTSGAVPVGVRCHAAYGRRHPA